VVVSDTLRVVVSDTLRVVVSDTLRVVVSDTLRVVVNESMMSVIVALRKLSHLSRLLGVHSHNHTPVDRFACWSPANYFPSLVSIGCPD